jgi:predicted phosphodiesterase
MRFVVFSDIHNNFHALEATVADAQKLSPDEIFVAGDFLNRGPQPREVLSFLRAQKWPMLRGNHEDYVLAQCAEFDSDDPRANPIWQPARWTAQQIGKQADDVADLSIWREFYVASNIRVLVVHGTPQLNNDGIFGRTGDDEIRAMLESHFENTGDFTPISLLVCAHTHVPLLRYVGRTLVVNIGATGLPFNGDERAQYGVFTWKNHTWDVELKRVEYSKEATVQAAHTNNFYDGGGPLARVIMEEFKTARPHLGPWVRDFGDEVRSGKLSVAKAVAMYFQNLR